MKLTKIDKEACKTIQEAATAALQAVAESHGLAVKAAGGRYDGVIFTAKFEFALTSEDGQAISREAEDFKHYCSLYNLKPEHLGAEFKINGDDYVLIGVAMGSPKYPLLARRVRDGRTRKFTEALAAKLRFLDKVKEGAQ